MTDACRPRALSISPPSISLALIITHHARAGQLRTRRLDCSRPPDVRVLRSGTSVDGRHCPRTPLQARVGPIRRNKPSRARSRLPNCRGALPRAWVRTSIAAWCSTLNTGAVPLTFTLYATRPQPHQPAFGSLLGPYCAHLATSLIDDHPVLVPFDLAELSTSYGKRR